MCNKKCIIIKFSDMYSNNVILYSTVGGIVLICIGVVVVISIVALYVIIKKRCRPHEQGVVCQ